MAARKTEAEWDRIELEYLAGEDSVRVIADRYCISDTAIRTRAKRERWVRGVRRPERANFRELSPPEPPAAPIAPPDPERIADRGRDLLARMLHELDTTTSRADELDYLIEGACAEDSDDKRRDALAKVVSLDGRANTLKTLATAYKTLNDAAAPLGKKAAQQEKAHAPGRFGTMAPPGASRSVN
jgi:hypothetical protein